MKHCQSGLGKMLVTHVGSDNKYMMDMLEGMFGAPVCSEAEDKPNKKHVTKRVTSKPAGHPGLNNHPKCSEEIKYITPPGFPVETDFGIRGMINKPERVGGKSSYFCSVSVCNKPSQNRTTLINHIRREHLNQKLRCLLYQ